MYYYYYYYYVQKGVNEWKNLMVTWKNKQLRAVCRKVDEEGLHGDSLPFLSLALLEVKQTVTDAVQGGAVEVERELELESSDQ
jgi:hypothetical protein